MYKLGSRLRNFAKIGAFNSHTKGNFKVFISDANVPGEGEQKIMEFIKSGESKQNGLYPNIVIYGLDADLIVLAIMLKRNNIKLLREVQNTTTELIAYQNEEFVYFDIDKCLNSIFNEYNLSQFERNDLINDFAFITMFGGNDFVEPFLHTKMKDNGLEKIMVSYTQILKESGNHVITDEGDVNFDFIIKWLSKISEIEDYCVRKINNVYKHTKFDDAQHDINYEKELYEHSMYKDKRNPFHKHYIEEFKKIDYKQENIIWKKQFNEYYFKNSNINDICTDYLISIKWNWLYYNNKAIGWSWYYKHRHSPLCSELCDYLKRYNIKTFKLLWNSIQFSKDDIMTPFEQLLIVTPIQHNYILPFCISQFLKDNGSDFPLMFPMKFELDVVKGGKNIYSDPLLHEVEIDLIRVVIKNCVYSESELLRNKINDKLFCHVIK
jgi:5'-3' exonuclease